MTPWNARDIEQRYQAFPRFQFLHTQDYQVHDLNPLHCQVTSERSIQPIGGLPSNGWDPGFCSFVSESKWWIYNLDTVHYTKSHRISVAKPTASADVCKNLIVWLSTPHIWYALFHSWATSPTTNKVRVSQNIENLRSPNGVNKCGDTWHVDVAQIWENSWKLRWQWRTTIWRCISNQKWWFSHGHVCFPGCIIP